LGSLITLQLDGIKEAVAKIKKLEGFEKKRTKIISILRSSAKPLLLDMKGRAPKSTGGSHTVTYSKGGNKFLRPGSLKRSHGIMRSRNRRIAQVLVGPRGGKKAGKNEGFYGKFVHEGEGNHKNARKYLAASVRAVGPSVAAMVSKRLQTQLLAIR